MGGSGLDVGTPALQRPTVRLVCPAGADDGSAHVGAWTGRLHRERGGEVSGVCVTAATHTYHRFFGLRAVDGAKVPPAEYAHLIRLLRLVPANERCREATWIRTFDAANQETRTTLRAASH